MTILEEWCVSQRESSDAAFAAELGGFRKSLTTFVAEFGQLAFNHRLNRRRFVSRDVLVETADHIVGAASVV